jgi:hypothetical protein
VTRPAAAPTPGPWSVLEGRPTSIAVGDLVIAHVFGSSDGRELPKAANARLIAAAPDLRDALRLAEAFISVATPMVAADRGEAIESVLPKIRAALAKAGQP